MLEQYKQATVEELRILSEANKQGIVILNQVEMKVPQWVETITNMLKTEKILSEQSNFEDCYCVKTPNNTFDICLVLPQTANVDKFIMWRDMYINSVLLSEYVK